MGKINDHTRRRTTFSEDELWRIFVQMVYGLKALHDFKILHRDMKCANIFLAKDGQVKLGDLNVSKVAKKGLLYTQTGTPYYASPEVWKDKPYDAKSDIWSLGCVLYEAAALHPPFRAADMKGLYEKVVAGKYPEIPRTYSSELSGLVRSLLQQNPSMRPSCGKYQATSWCVEQILSLPCIAKRTKSLDVVSSVNEALAEGKILGTIILPKNLNVLSSRLPRPNYRPPSYLKKTPSVPGELQDAGRRIASSHQVRGMAANASSADVLAPTGEQQAIPQSSPSSQDMQNSNKPPVRPVIRSRKPERPQVPCLKNMYQTKQHPVIGDSTTLRKSTGAWRSGCPRYGVPR